MLEVVVFIIRRVLFVWFGSYGGFSLGMFGIFLSKHSQP